MKPYLAQFLRARDLAGFEEILKLMVSPREGDTRRTVFRSIELMIPDARRLLPFISEQEMIEMSLARVADLDLPADLYERDASERASMSPSNPAH